MVQTTNFKLRERKKTLKHLKPLKMEIELNDGRWKYVVQPYTRYIKAQTMMKQ
jgi:hypothetical protein